MVALATVSHSLLNSHCERKSRENRCEDGCGKLGGRGGKEEKTEGKDKRKNCT